MYDYADYLGFTMIGSACDMDSVVRLSESTLGAVLIQRLSSQSTPREVQFLLSVSRRLKRLGCV